MAVREGTKRSGSNVSRNPKAEKRAQRGPGKQQQAYPGSTRKMKPRPDHGEKSYQGSGNGIS